MFKIPKMREPHAPVVSSGVKALGEGEGRCPPRPGESSRKCLRLTLGLSSDCAAAAVAVADAVEGDVEAQTRRQREHEWLAYADDPKAPIFPRISDIWQDVNATAKTSGCTQRGSLFPRTLLKDIEDVDKT